MPIICIGDVFAVIGGQTGNVLALSIGGLMCSWDFAGGWPLIFYSAGKY